MRGSNIARGPCALLSLNRCGDAVPKTSIKNFGLGRQTFKNATKIPLGSARDSLNLLHYDEQSAAARNFIDRVNATAPAARTPTVILVKKSAGMSKVAPDPSGLYRSIR